VSEPSETRWRATGMVADDTPRLRQQEARAALREIDRRVELLLMPAAPGAH